MPQTVNVVTLSALIGVIKFQTVFHKISNNIILKTMRTIISFSPASTTQRIIGILWMLQSYKHFDLLAATGATDEKDSRGKACDEQSIHTRTKSGEYSKEDLNGLSVRLALVFFAMVLLACLLYLVFRASFANGFRELTASSVNNTRGSICKVSWPQRLICIVILSQCGAKTLFGTTITPTRRKSAPRD